MGSRGWVGDLLHVPMGAVATGADAEALEELYQKYRADDDDEEMIGAAGIERFCDDIGIDPMDPVILVVALKMNAQQMGKFTKEEFLMGCAAWAQRRRTS